MELIISIAGLVLGAIGTYFAYVQVRGQLTKSKTARIIDQQRESNPVSDSSGPQLRIVTVHDLHALGMTTKRIVEVLVSMDYDNLDGAEEEDVGQVVTWTPIVDNNPDGMRILVDQHNDIIGYWHFLPLDDDTYDKAKAGTLDDGEIRLHNLTVIGPPGDYNMFFIMICIQPHNRGVAALRMLLDAFVDALHYLAKKDIYFPEMCATAFSPEGEALCKTLHMRHVAQHTRRGKIYYLDFRSVPSGLFYNKELHALYRQRYCSPSLSDVIETSA